MLKSNKRYLSLLLILSMVLMVACSSSPGEQGNKQNSNATNVSSDNTQQETQKDKAKRETVEEQVLLDQNDIKITLKSLEFDGLFGPSLKVFIENNSTAPITVQVRDSSINEIMVESIFSCDVAPGKKANDKITFMESELEYAQIETIQNFELKFHVFNSDTWDVIFDSTAISIDTISDQEYTQKYDESGIVALDENDIKVVIKRVSSEDSFWGADVYVYIENNTDQDITIQTRDVSINGIMVDPIFSSEVVAGKKAYDTITFLESDLIDNDIKSIDNMELSFHIFETDGWNAIMDTPAIEVNFE